MYQNTMLHDMFVYNIYEKKKPHTLESVHFYYVFKLLCSEAIFFLTAKDDLMVYHLMVHCYFSDPLFFCASSFKELGWSEVSLISLWWT